MRATTIAVILALIVVGITLLVLADDPLYGVWFLAGIAAGVVACTFTR